ncbi:AraC family transcriptional regulator [Paenibacillus cremeus]|uniref:AraC family transcriptional regulator n=1 Tax=Paenibacillus cremeus TaxID=2163881 RepID=A0A559K0E9_9BACL|nr:AraC family transcriptional regulator [Paenibacillus cremeus]TVY05603.1 AraC family transcriptional regulator [Paenibacillus cremeus]
MEKEFLHQFYPRILDVTHRSTSFWEGNDYRVQIPSTKVYNLAFMYEGEGQLVLNGERYELKEGSIFHISPGMRMELSSSRSKPLRYFGVQFHQLRIQWEGSDCQTSMSDAPLPFRRVLFLPRNSLHIHVAAMYDGWQEKEAGYEWQAKLGLFQLLDQLCSIVIAEQTRQESSYLQMESSVRYIRHNYAEPLTRDRLADQASMSISHFSAVFKNVIGISPQQFVEKVRIDQAKSMLSGTTKPISQVAKEVGYSDPLYFTRVFTKVTGMAPREYRGG